MEVDNFDRLIVANADVIGQTVTDGHAGVDCGKVTVHRMTGTRLWGEGEGAEGVMGEVHRGVREEGQSGT